MASRLRELQGLSAEYGELMRRLSLSAEQVNCQSPVATAILSQDKDSGSPGAVPQDAGSLDSSGSSSIPFSWGVRSPGKVSPLRGRTMKEYEEQLAALRKENFALKLRIYFLEERVGQKGEKEDKEQLYRTNIELKVETEALKQEVYDKQELVREASAALAALEQQYQHQLDAATQSHHHDTQHLHDTIAKLQKEVDEYAEKVRQSESDANHLGELTQLCGLAFPTEEITQEHNTPWGAKQGGEDGNTGKTKGENDVEMDDMWSENAPMSKGGMWGDMIRSPNTPASTTTPIPCQTTSLLSSPAADPSLSLYGGGPTSPSHLQGLFSLQEALNETPKLAASPVAPLQSEGEVVGQLRHRVRELEDKVEELEGQLAEKDVVKSALEGDLNNLKKEMEEKEERVSELEGEVADRDERLEEVIKELDTQQTQLVDKDEQISSLYNHLNRVQPEMEVKVQEIVERDRIIEEKIEQIEQQNKILVEIQITLDEKQKQLADAETKLSEAESKRAEAEARATEANERADKLALDLEKSCKVIQTFAEEVQARDKEIAQLKKDAKRKEKKIRDLMAELKQTLDMLNKAKWEAETSGGEDGVKDMAEEENERLWAEVEARKNEVLSLRAAADAAAAAAEERTKALTQEIEALTAQREKHLQDTDDLKNQLQQLQVEAAGRESQLVAAKGHTEGLEAQLMETRTQLEQKRQRLAALEDNMRATAAGELDRRANQVDKLQDQLAALATRNTPEQNQGTSTEIRVIAGQITQGQTGQGLVEQGQVGQGLVEQGQIGQGLVEQGQVGQLEGGQGKILEDGEGRTDITPGFTLPSVTSVLSNSKLNVSLPEDSLKYFELYQDVCRIKDEADALRKDRARLYDQLVTLRQLYNISAQDNTNPVTTSSTQTDSISSLTTAIQTENTIMSLASIKPTDLITPASSNIPILDLSIPESTQHNLASVTTPAITHNLTLDLPNTQIFPTFNLTAPANTNASPAITITTPSINLTHNALIPTITHPSITPNTSQTAPTSTATSIVSDITQVTQIQCNPSSTDSANLNTPSPLPGTNMDTTIRSGKLETAKVELKLQKASEEPRKEDKIVGQTCQAQVEALKTELEEAQKVGEELGRAGAEQLRRHKSEIARLRRRLAESHTACDLLRTRLEELADFLDSILDLEGRGIISLDSLPPEQLAALHNSLDQSRALSRTLSQSLMIGMETGEESMAPLLGETTLGVQEESAMVLAPDTLGVRQSITNFQTGLDSSSHPRRESVFGLTNTTIDMTQDTTGLSHNTTQGIDEDRAKIVQALATRLTTQLDQKTRELDAIAESVSDLTNRLANRTSQVTQQAGIISQLRNTVDHLTAQLASLGPHQDHTTQDSGHSSDPLPPPPLHLLRDSECEAGPGRASEPSSLGAIKSAYSTDAAIKAHSGRLAQQIQHEVPGESAGVAGVDQWIASPSESEAWSEPDRNVSLARIGLDATTLAATPERPTPRPRQTRAALTSESEGELQHDDLAATPVNMKPTKRRSDVAELRRVSTRLKAVEQLNDTLRAELHLYHNLTHHLQPHQLTSSTTPLPTTPTPDTPTTTATSDASQSSIPTNTHVPTISEAYNPALTTLISATASTSTSNPRLEAEVALATPILAEVRGLRVKLEEAIENNDHLRDQLEAALSAHPHEEARFLHLTAALQTAQEEVREARERCNAAQGQAEEAKGKAEELQREANEMKSRLEEERMKVTEANREVNEVRKRTEEIETEVKEARNEARKLRTEADEAKSEAAKLKSEASKMSQVEEEARVEVAELKAKSEARINELIDLSESAKAKQVELEENVRQMSVHITSLEGEVQRLEEEVAEKKKRAVEEGRRLEEKERRLLEVNKERMALVGERARLHARITTQAEDKRRMEVEKEELVEEKKRMRVETTELKEDRRKLLEEVNRLEDEQRERGTSMEAERERGASIEKSLEVEREKIRSIERDLENEREKGKNIEKDLVKEQEKGKNMERNLEKEREKWKLMERDLEMEREKRLNTERDLEAVQKRGKNTEAELEAEVECLRRDLEAERQVTAELQQRLDKMLTIHSPTSTTASQSDHLVVLPAASDASHESVTSIEYFPRSSRPQSGLWGCHGSLSPTPTPSSPTPLPPPPHHTERDTSRTSSRFSSSSRYEKDNYRRDGDMNTSRRERSSSRRENTSTRRESSSRRDRELSRKNRDTSTSKQDRDSSISKRESNISKRVSMSPSSHWSEDKENLFISASNTTTTNTTTIGNKRSCRLEGHSDRILALSAPNLTQDDDDDELDIYGDPDYADGETTSGESPDLGIGSDNQFSSLERGTTTTKAISTTAGYYHHTSIHHHHNLLPHSPPSLPTQLCSEPSHSVLTAENDRLRGERDNLAARLTSTMATLQETHQKLSKANQRKETVERAICKQLHKTHHVLKRANDHIKQAGSLPQ